MSEEENLEPNKFFKVIENEKKEIKCQFCGNIFNEADLPIRIETTDILLGVNWGVPSWKEYEIKYCPDCMFPLMRDNKKIEYRKV